MLVVFYFRAIITSNRSVIRRTLDPCVEDRDTHILDRILIVCWRADERTPPLKPLVANKFTTKSPFYTFQLI